jgi:signal transduction histidine kinase
MRDVGHRRRAEPLPDVLLALDEQYAGILALLDRESANRHLVCTVPESTGVEVAWIGEPRGVDEIVLRHSVNGRSGLIEGLVVPVGTGLGGQVLRTRRPLWVSDYCASPDISNHFKQQAGVEGLMAMIAVPIVDGQFLGVLYGANRERTAFGDRTTRALEQVAARMATAQIVAERARHAAEVAVHEERRRLALELHDTVGAMLFTLGAGIRRLGDEPGLDASVRSRLATIEQQAMDASAVLRGSLRALSAPPEQVSLGVAVRAHCRAFSERTGTTARTITLSELPLPHCRVRALADTVREALLNAEKHASARSVMISVAAIRGGVAVTVADDGVGLGTDHAGRPGLGLPALSDRLDQVGGSLSVTTNEDGGVTVQAWVPA